MRKEKVAGYVGLGLVSLFPLLGAFQADPSESGWQAAAARTRPSVLGVHVRSDSTGRPVGCAVLLSSAPLRAVVAGSWPGRSLQSGQAGDRIDWRSAYVDPQGEFTILEAKAGRKLGTAAASGSSFLSSVVPLDPATVGDLGPAGESLDPVDAILVSPAQFVSPMWIGELRFERSVAGRPVYAARSVRPLPGSGAAIAATDSEVEPPSRFAIDPALRGAPFVTLDGVVLGLYLGEGEGRPRAVPMALVREALSGLGRRAAS